MIADQIQKTDQSLEGRGLPPDSFFTVEFLDGSSLTEKEANWSVFSHRQVVDGPHGKQICFVCNYPVKKITVTLNGLTACIDNIPEGAEAYQFIKSERLLAKGIDRSTISGRGIGLIKNGSIVEERFIDTVENSVTGMRI